MQNLLLDAAGNLKISDFGMARLYIGDPDADGDVRAELLHTTCGTPNYVAPEVLTCKGYDGHTADVWSMGVILYVLLAGYLPFEEATTAALFKKIKNADYSYPTWFEPAAISLLQRILVVDPKLRIDLTEFRNSDFIADADTPSTPPFPLVPEAPPAKATAPAAAAAEPIRKEKKKSHLSNTHVPELIVPPTPPSRSAASDDESENPRLMPLTVDTPGDHERNDIDGNSTSASLLAAGRVPGQPQRKTAEGGSPGMFECICNPFSTFAVSDDKP
jgi:serine/threonine protein kinase